jgi:hypothetical protein
VCGNTIVRAKIEINGKIMEEVLKFKYLGSIMSQYNADSALEYRIETFYRMIGITGSSFGKQMTKENQLGLYNITSKAARKYGSEIWVLKQIRISTNELFKSTLGTDDTGQN